MSLLRSSAVMAAGTVLSRITGLVRDVVMTAALGFFIASDAYSLGNTLPNIISILIAGGALNAVFIPQLVRHIKEDNDGGTAYADRLLTVVTIWMVFVTTLAIVFAPQLVAIYASSSYTADQAALATAFARWCLPQIVFYGLFTMWSQVLNSRGHFAMPMFAPILNNLVAIAVFVLFMASTTSEQIAAAALSPDMIALLGGGTTLSVIVQALSLIPALGKAGYRYRPRFDLKGHGLGKAGTLALWTLGLVIVNQLAYVVVTRLATNANVQAINEGAAAAGLTTYQKAHLMFILPHSVITVSLVTALLPQLSRIAVDGQLATVGQQIARAMRTIAVLILPIAAIFVVIAPEITRLLFGFGAATYESASITGGVLQVFALGLLPFTLIYVLFRGWYSLEDTRSPFMVTLLINAVSLCVSIPLFYAVPLGFKVQSLAVAYILGYWLSLFVAWPFLERRLGTLDTHRTLRSLVRTLIAAIIGGLAGRSVYMLLQEAFGTAGRPELLLLIGVVAGTTLAVYVAFARLLHVEDVKKAITLLRRRGE